MSPLLAVFEPGGDAATALYIVAFALFIIGIKQGTHPTTAKRGNLIAAVGMAVAVVTTLLLDGMGNWGLIALGLGIGTAIGVIASIRVQMTEMPQMVALYNGVGGGAVALIAWSEIRHGISIGEDFPLDSLIPVIFAGIVGSVSFWGSNIAFAKLQDLIPTRPIAAPGQQVINAILLLAIVVISVMLAIDHESPSEGLFILLLVLAAILGNLVVLPIGGADMPVVISLLNAFTGLSAAAAGFALDNVALIVAGTLVGSSGTILTMEMATAMNRSVGNILFSGFGGAPSGGGGGGGEERPHVSIGAQDAAIKLAYADSVVIVPGYGLAVAQAQHAIKEVADELEKRGVTVNYAIHPVAGRMPGHMNVLLAEADVPYENLKEMEEINPEMSRTDVAVVVGANDVTNPAAKNDPDSPIAGMPIIEVNEAQQVIVIKRSLSPGFAGIDNDLFYEPNTSMLFADAKAAASEIAAEIGNL
ncbi:MAG TPA: NAD(P)(+) transhydrogenase (Re/Si-specific) subunit beta [Solirubrobacterales bacterium]|jgi:NAD(P) transhydrogenase subunit beta|nr:NAD(P)(+) transhydrogenase (Re/Si-specific) subunit beta [Solirubrobacterales bacterium]